MIASDCVFGQLFANGCCYTSSGTPDLKCPSGTPHVAPFEVVGVPGNSWFQPSGTPGQPIAPSPGSLYSYLTSPAAVVSTPVNNVVTTPAVVAATPNVQTAPQQAQVQQQAITGTRPINLAEANTPMPSVAASLPAIASSFDWSTVLLIGGVGIAALFLFSRGGN